MVVHKTVICPTCGKKTDLRVQIGSYGDFAGTGNSAGHLDSYPIRIHCGNCRTLIKGKFILSGNDKPYGLRIENAKTEDNDVDPENFRAINVDFVSEISGELPCRKTKLNRGKFDDTPFMTSAIKMGGDEMRKWLRRLSSFSSDINEWHVNKNTPFQLLEDGCIQFVPLTCKDWKECNFYSDDEEENSICYLQDIMRQEMQYLLPRCSGDKDSYIHIALEIAAIEDNFGEELHKFLERIGGRRGLIDAYRKTVSIFCSFMDIYPYVLPAEAYLRYKDKTDKEVGISTCTFSDLKTFYFESYEKLLSLIYIPVCLDNISQRGSYSKYGSKIERILQKKDDQSGTKDFLYLYQEQDNGWRSDNYSSNEPLQRMINLRTNKNMRNGIGHATVEYDGMTQLITFYSLQNPPRISLRKSLIDFAVECIGFAKSSVLLAETIHFLIVRETFLSEKYSS